MSSGEGEDDSYDPPYWKTQGYGADFGIDQYQAMADFMRNAQGRVLVSINDHPEIREVFEGFRFEELQICYSSTNQRKGKAAVTGELAIMNW